MATTAKRNYRATFILDSRNHQEGVDDMIARLSKGIESVDGEIKETENLGTKEFTRVTDRNFPTGIYVQVSFAGPPSAPAAVQEKFRLDRSVDRIFVEVLDK